MLFRSAGNIHLQPKGGTNNGILYVSGSTRFGLVSSQTHQFTGSVSISGSLNATSSWATNALTASFLPVGTYNITSSWANNTVSASYATTAQTANSLVSSNSYTVDGLTANYVEVTGLATIPTTGIYRPSTKALGLSADGTLVFKISNASAPATSSIETGNFIVGSGNVGIGLSSPSYTLHVNGGGQKDICTVLGRSFGDGNFILTTLNGTSSNSANEVVSKIGLSYSNTGSQNAYVRSEEHNV